MNHTNQQHIISVAGTVGVGKTTMVQAISEHLNYEAVFENPKSNPYLEHFYQDFKKWAFHTQIHFLSERFKQQTNMRQNPGHYVQDRSIYEDKDIFTALHYADGNIDGLEYHTYLNLYNSMVENPDFRHPDLMIYLTASHPNDIIDRIKNRGRPSEQRTPYAYWLQLYERYEEWIHQFNICPVLEINIGDYDLIHDSHSRQSILEKISELI